MGTRADFYVGRGPTAEWLGSIAWDGYPSGVNDDRERTHPPTESPILTATDEATYRQQVSALLAKRTDATLPDEGWPWPWEDSRTTDYAYSFDDGRVWASSFGSAWWEATQDEPEHLPQAATFPDMTDRMRVQFGRKSGLVIVTGNPDPAVGGLIVQM